jgi:hypothetical protein
MPEKARVGKGAGAECARTRRGHLTSGAGVGIQPAGPVAELVDAPGLGPGAAKCGGSSPFWPTKV